MNKELNQYMRKPKGDPEPCDKCGYPTKYLILWGTDRFRTRFLCKACYREETEPKENTNHEKET